MPDGDWAVDGEAPFNVEGAADLPAWQVLYAEAK